MMKFKVGKLAKLLDVHRNTITNWIKKGQLDAVSIEAKQYKITKKKLLQFFENQAIPSAVQASVFEYVDQQHRPTLSKSGKEKKRSGKTGAVLIVGGGISGIQSAMDLADAGFYVYLVERTSGIGGTMTQLDKTFPTNECASCIVLPKLVECERHRNIKVLTLSQVTAVSGKAGRFKVEINQQADYIDSQKCIACGVCAQKCPVNTPDSFNCGINTKKAIFIRHEQSVPHKYAIDSSACRYFTADQCRICQDVCPTQAVEFSQKDTQITIVAGAVILAPGVKPFDPGKYDYFGYRNNPDVVTSLEFERLLSVNGPTRGNLRRPSDNASPKNIAWILCAGSRNINNNANLYCSSICCMVAVKQSRVSIEHTRGKDFNRTVFFMDLRSCDKESEPYFKSAKEEGVRFIRALPHTIESGVAGRGARIRYVDEQGNVEHADFDMVVLSIGLEAQDESRHLARLFKIRLDSYQFAATSCFKPVKSSQKGIFVVGPFESPKAIPRSVVQASAAAADVSELLLRQRWINFRKKVFPKEKSIQGKTPLVGVFVCSCGINIADTIDVQKVVDNAAQMPFVGYAGNHLFSCSVDAQENIIQKIRDLNLNRVVIAACTPKTHEPVFQETLRNAKLNGFMMEMANIRNQNSWVHQEDRIRATQKAQDQVRMAVAKVIHNYPISQDRFNANQKVLVVGGGLSGMVSALTLSRLGHEIILVEQSDQLGGNALRLKETFKGEPVQPVLQDLTRQIEKNNKIKVLTSTVLKGVDGSVGNFSGGLQCEGNTIQIQFGAAIMATGAKEATPSEYLYGLNKNVFTQLDFDEGILNKKNGLDNVSSVVFIQCVGSREPGRLYCSQICCIHSVKAAIQIKQKSPQTLVYILYRDLRTYGEWEVYYKKARDLGVVFVRYHVDNKPVVEEKNGKIYISITDPIIDALLVLKPDYLVLASGARARENKELADLFKFSVDADGFFKGVHPKLRPVDLTVTGLFLAGLCNYPKPISESIEQAKAAAQRVFALLSQNEIRADAVKAFFTDACDGCALCIDVCPFHALSIEMIDKNVDGKNVKMSVDPVLCQGCGLCAATCNKDGIMVHGFTKPQMLAQVRAAVDKGTV